MKSEQFYIFLVLNKSNQSILDFKILKKKFRMQFKILEKTPLRIFGFLPMYTHWILHFGGLRTLNHEPNKQYDRLPIRDSPTNVKWPPDPRYSFFTTQKYDDIHDSSFENFWKAYIWICASLHWLQSNAPDVRIIFKDFVWVNACPPTAGGGRSTQNKNVCVDALHHKPTCP